MFNLKEPTFAAIDFETANYHYSSICSVGLVVVRDGAVVDKIYRLIRPAPDWYMWQNTRVHGLRASDTRTAPEFPQVWQEIMPHIAGLPLVAHNSAFDSGCLRAACAFYKMRYPDYEFHCTCVGARRRFGDAIPNHKLPTAARYCGYILENHHHALADAEACAAIAVVLCGMVSN